MKKISAWVGAVPRKEVVCSAWQMLGMLGVVLGYLAYRRTFRHVDACNIVYT